MSKNLLTIYFGRFILLNMMNKNFNAFEFFYFFGFSNRV